MSSSKRSTMEQSDASPQPGSKSFLLSYWAGGHASIGIAWSRRGAARADGRCSGLHPPQTRSRGEPEVQPQKLTALRLGSPGSRRSSSAPQQPRKPGFFFSSHVEMLIIHFNVLVGRCQWAPSSSQITLRMVYFWAPQADLTSLPSKDSGS